MMKWQLALLAGSALAVAAPAEAAVVNYSFGGVGSGSMALNLSGGSYTLSTLSLTMGTFTWNQSNSAMALFSGSTYLLGSTQDGLGVDVSIHDDFFAAFDPSLSSQTASLLNWSNSSGGGIHAGSLTITQVAGSVPEPASWALMLLGFAGTGLALRRSRRKTALA